MLRIFQLTAVAVIVVWQLSADARAIQVEQDPAAETESAAGAATSDTRSTTAQESPGAESAATAEAAPTTDPVVDEPDAITELRSRIEQLKSQVADAELEDIVRTEVDQLLVRAEADLQSALAQMAAETATKTKIEGLPALKAEQEQPIESSPIPDLDSLSIADLEARRTQKQLELTAQRQIPTSPEVASEEAAARKRDLQQQRAAVEQALAENDVRLKAIPTENTTLQDSVARAAGEARQQQLTAQRNALQAAEAEVDTRMALGLPAIRARRQQKLITTIEQELEALKAALEQRSREESARQLELAQTAVDDLNEIDDPELREMARKRLEYAATNSLLTEQTIPETQQRVERGVDLLKRLEEDSKQIQESVREFGLSGTIGRELLDFQERLPTAADVSRDIARLEEQIAEQRILINDFSAELDQAEEAAAALEISEDEQSIRAAEQIDGLIQVTRTLQENSTRLKNLLGDIYTQKLSLAEFVQSWDDYVSEQALWVRSHEILNWTDLREAPEEAQEVASELQRGLPSVGSGGFSVWAVLVPALIAILLLLAVQEKARRSLVENGEQAARRACISIRPTVRALLLSFGMAAEWPLLLMFGGNVLRFGSGGVGVYAGLGMAIAQLGTFTLWLNFFRQFLRRGGLAEVHFDWNPIVNDRLRRWLRNVILLVSPPLLLLLVAKYCANGDERVERLLFIGIMLLCTGLLAQLLLPVSNKFMKALLKNRGWIYRTRVLWVGFSVLLPLTLAVLSLVGFHYTAVELWIRISRTVVLASLLLVADGFLLRWLRLSHRATRMALARERAAQRGQQQTEASGGEEAGSSIPPVPADDEGLAVFGLQANALMRNACLLTLVGVSWAIWFDVLPALKVLDRHEVWTVREEVSVTEIDEDGVDQTTTVIKPYAVTVGNLILAAFTTIVTVIAVRQLPGLIELIMLSRVKLESGIRYAITTVTRYLVLVAGIVIVCGLVGLRWSQVQWLVAGLSVGLGFGLQEVFANFVSGIIILLERPVRIGDIVTIDGISGVVSRIQIRATSITDWDRREYIVPNKEFVTGKLLNWTLSDTTNRIVVNVGVAYGTDTDKAREIMLDVARKHPQVLADPPPIATFENFGDSSLDLVLRAYLPSLEHRLPTISEIFTEIHRKFAEAEINIPFPQRDLHIFTHKIREDQDQLPVIVAGRAAGNGDGEGDSAGPRQS